MRGGLAFAWFMLMVIVIIGSCIWFFNSLNACNAKGGSLVRGAFGYVCVASPR